MASKTSTQQFRSLSVISKPVKLLKTSYSLANKVKSFLFTILTKWIITSNNVQKFINNAFENIKFWMNSTIKIPITHTYKILVYLV